MPMPVFLDCNATTPVDPRVVEAMLPCFTQTFGNASSVTNRYGQAALELLENARAEVATTAGAEAVEVMFTSGATESINTVLQGIVRGKSWSDVQIITATTEHSAVLDTCGEAEKRGATVTRLPVNQAGHVDLDHLASAMKTAGPGALVSLMHANNEIGTVHPIKSIARLCQTHGCLLHVDAAQSFGKIPLDCRAWGVHFLSISAHKIYGPKGAGALVIRRQVPPLRLRPLLFGGGQERSMRSGTVNIPGAVGLGEAARLARQEMAEEYESTKALRDHLMERLLTELDGAVVNGCLEQRLPGNLNISFPGLHSPELLLPRLQNAISVSSGSACKSAARGPSHVLLAIGVDPTLALANLRFGIGRFTTAEEIDFAADTVIETVKALRQA